MTRNSPRDFCSLSRFSAGDTDTLFINGPAPANPGTSGNKDVIANFQAAGDVTHPLVRFYDAGASPAAPVCRRR